MDIFFQESSATPLPPDEVRLRTLKVEPYPDGRRLRVEIEITPFQKRPCLTLTVTDPAGHTVTEAEVLETMATRLELTLHLRGPAPAGAYTLCTSLFYAPLPSPEETHLPPRKVVDERCTNFTI